MKFLYLLAVKLAASSSWNAYPWNPDAEELKTPEASDQVVSKKRKVEESWDNFVWDPEVEDLTLQGSQKESFASDSTSAATKASAPVYNRVSPTFLPLVEKSGAENTYEGRKIMLRGMLKYPTLGSVALIHALFPEGCDWCRNFFYKTKFRGKLSLCAYHVLKNQFEIDRSTLLAGDLLGMCGKQHRQSGPALQAWVDIVIARGERPNMDSMGQFVEMTSSQFDQLLEYEIQRISRRLVTPDSTGGQGFGRATAAGLEVSGTVPVVARPDAATPLVIPNASAVTVAHVVNSSTVTTPVALVDDAPVAQVEIAPPVGAPLTRFESASASPHAQVPHSVSSNKNFRERPIEQMSHADRISVLYLMHEYPFANAEDLWQMLDDQVDTAVTVEQVKVLLVEMLSKSVITLNEYSLLVALDPKCPLGSELKSLWEIVVIHDDIEPRLTKTAVHMTREQYRTMLSIIMESEADIKP